MNHTIDSLTNICKLAEKDPFQVSRIPRVAKEGVANYYRDFLCNLNVETLMSYEGGLEDFPLEDQGIGLSKDGKIVGKVTTVPWNGHDHLKVEGSYSQEAVQAAVELNQFFSGMCRNTLRPFFTETFDIGKVYQDPYFTLEVGRELDRFRFALPYEQHEVQAEVEK